MKVIEITEDLLHTLFKLCKHFGIAFFKSTDYFWHVWKHFNGQFSYGIIHLVRAPKFWKTNISYPLIHKQLHVSVGKKN